MFPNTKGVQTGTVLKSIFAQRIAALGLHKERPMERPENPLKLGQRTDMWIMTPFLAISKTSPVSMFLRNARNAEHSERNMRSVMKTKIIRKYPKALLYWCSIFMRPMFLKQNSKRSSSGYFPTNCWAQRKQHAKRDEEYAWKRILNFIKMQIFLLATNACNYLRYEACNKNKNQQTKHFRQLNQTIWLVCYHMIIGDRSIDNILRGFLSFTNLST